MSEKSEKSERAFQHLVGVLEEAVRAGADSVGLEREGGDLMVVQYSKNSGLALGPIPEELEQALVDEIIDRASLAHTARGEIQINLAGKDYKVIVDERDESGGSAFNLLLKKTTRSRKSPGEPVRKASMRLSESKIKQAILHPEQDIRSRALRYFSRSYCRDESIMPLVKSAVETYGKQDAYHLIGLSRHLKQTEDSISWIIDELNDRGNSAYENYIYNLSMILLHAHPDLIVGKESRIIDAPHLPDGWREVIEGRLEMLSWDADTCWRKITEICEDGKDEQYVDRVALGEAGRFVEALGRIGGDYEDRIHACLSLQIHFDQSTPVKWMQPLLIQLAGEVRLESAIPLILDKLETGDDVLMEECECALTKIGTDSVVKEIADRFDDAPRDFRLYATGPLEHIHCDLAVETSLRAFPHEQDRIVKKDLIHAALAHFSTKAVEPVRRLLLGRKLSGEERHLRDYLVETCRIMEVLFPEYDDWLAAGRAERQEHKEKMDELRNDPNGMLANALERLREYKELGGSEEREAPSDLPVAISNEDDAPRNEFEAEPATPSHQKTGRNDPCPCGSGKKYKKCCLKKRNDGSLYD